MQGAEATPSMREEVGWRLVSQTAEYALRGVLHIARRGQAEPVPTPDIAAALQAPEKYLARVLNTLAHAGTLRSVRGARGGFLLGRAASDIALADVLAPFEPAGAAPRCLLRGEQCGTGRPCASHAVWHDVASVVKSFFDETTVADMLHGRAALPIDAVAVSPDVQECRRDDRAAD